MLRNNEEYIPLNPDGTDHDSAYVRGSAPTRNTVLTMTPLTFLSLFTLMLASSCLSLYSVFLTHAISSRLTSLQLPLSPSSLPRPNQFIGIDKIDPNAKPQHDTQFRFPDIIARISRTESHKVYDSDQDRNTVLITSENSMLFQWHNRPDGVESCTIAGIFPGVNERGGKLFHVSGNTEAMEVWNITAEADIDRHRLSYSNRPPRGNLLGRLNITEDINSKIPWFACPVNRIQTIEIACPSEACVVEFFMNYELPMLTIDLLQRE